MSNEVENFLFKSFCGCQKGVIEAAAATEEKENKTQPTRIQSVNSISIADVVRLAYHPHTTCNHPSRSGIFPGFSFICYFPNQNLLSIDLCSTSQRDGSCKHASGWLLRVPVSFIITMQTGKEVNVLVGSNNKKEALTFAALNSAHFRSPLFC